MNIFVKEYKDAITFSFVKKILKKNFTLKNFDYTEKINPEDLIFYTETDASFHHENFEGILISIEHIMKEFSQDFLQSLSVNYDRYYLQCAMKRAVLNDIDTLVIGSSYAMFGIDETIAPWLVNCGLPSQDLYYSNRIVSEILKKGVCVRNIVLVTSYYVLFSDLSRVESDYERLRISRVYYPLFNDVHHCIIMPAERLHSLQSSILNEEAIYDILSEKYYTRGYFSKITRRQYIGIDNKPLSNENKFKKGKERANLHGKSIRYYRSFEENIFILRTLSKRCKQENVNLLLVVPPMTKYYKAAAEPEFKTIFYKVFPTLEKGTVLLDLYDSPLFIDDDFVDMDHLDVSGAQKMTKLVADALKELNTKTGA